MENFTFTFLGTSALDFSPLLRTEFENKFDNDARRASCVLLGRNVLIDCGPHVLDSLAIINKNPSDITDILITHLHCDHFDARNTEKIAAQKKEPLRLYVRDDAVLPEMRNVNVVKIRRHKEYPVCRGVSVTSLYANHDESAYPQHLLIRANGKKLLYACDGAWFLTPTYNFLKNSKLDALVLDATVGRITGDYRICEHNSLSMIELLLPSLRAVGIVDEHTQIFLSHIAPSLHAPHAEISKSVDPLGVCVAYDGLEVIL